MFVSQDVAQISCIPCIIHEPRCKKTCLRVSDKVQPQKMITVGATYDDFSGQFFRIFEIIFCFVFRICDLVHAVEAMYALP